MEREIRWWMWWNDGRLFNFQRTIKNTCCWMFWLLCAKTHIIHLCTHFSSLALSTHTQPLLPEHSSQWGVTLMTLDLYLIVGPFISSKVIKDQLLLLRHQLAGSAFVLSSFSCLFSIPPMPFFHMYILLSTEDYTIWGISEAISQEKQCLTYILKIHNKAIQVKHVQTTVV